MPVNQTTRPIAIQRTRGLGLAGWLAGAVAIGNCTTGPHKGPGVIPEGSGGVK